MSNKPIARIHILRYPTNEEKVASIVDPNGELIVELEGLEGTSEKINVAALKRGDANNQGIADAFIQVFNACDYKLNANEVSVKVLKQNNNFKISASKVKDMQNNSEVITNHELVINFAVNNGNLIGDLFDRKQLEVNTQNAITQAEKDALTALGITVAGTNWNDFTITGKCLVNFVKKDSHTVFVGDTEFVTA